MLKEVMHLGEILGYLVTAKDKTFFLDKETVDEITFIPCSVYDQVDVVRKKEKYIPTSGEELQITDVSGVVSKITNLLQPYVTKQETPVKADTQIIVKEVTEKYGVVSYKVHISACNLVDIATILDIAHISKQDTEIGFNLNPQTQQYEVNEWLELPHAILHQIQMKYPVYIPACGYNYTTIIPHLDLELTKKLQPKKAVLNYHVIDIRTLQPLNSTLKENVC